METSRLDDRRRILEVTPGNLRQNHLYIRGLHDFFPADCYGPARRERDSCVAEIEILLDGLGEVARTDIAIDPSTGRPRSFFRRRTWVRRFFEHHQIAAGDRLALERTGHRTYRLSLATPDLMKESRSRPARPRAAEFFAGIGLVRLALERQGWDVVFANDIDPQKARMYRDNWPDDEHLHVGDIHALNSADLPDCDLFTASFPCNDLSIAGKWEGLNGKESSAFWGLIRLLQEMGDRRPKFVLLENVVGFLISQDGKDFETALTALSRLGYSIDAVILNAVRWTPQSRARLFVVAEQGAFPDRTSFALESDARPAALCQFINSHPDIPWGLRKLPPLPKPRRKLRDIVDDLPEDDPHWWNEERTAYFMGQLSERHAEQARSMISAEDVSYATAFRRVRNGRSMAELRTDGLAGCLRTPRGGSGRQILFKAGNGRRQVRLLTARECARLQGVPESYLIHVPLNQALFGFGDAVCVPAVEWIVGRCLSVAHQAIHGQNQETQDGVNIVDG